MPRRIRERKAFIGGLLGRRVGECDNSNLFGEGKVRCSYLTSNTNVKEGCNAKKKGRLL